MYFFFAYISIICKYIIYIFWLEGCPEKVLFQFISIFYFDIFKHLSMMLKGSKGSEAAVILVEPFGGDRVSRVLVRSDRGRGLACSSRSHAR